jgi:hypothetical protein
VHVCTYISAIKSDIADRRSGKEVNTEREEEEWSWYTAAHNKKKDKETVPEGLEKEIGY